MRTMGQGCAEPIHTARCLCVYALGVTALLWIGGCGGVFTEIPELDTADGRVFAQRCGACHGKPFGSHGITPWSTGSAVPDNGGMAEGIVQNGKSHERKRGSASDRLGA
jgi:mono/diheme cytochrome c family protein